MKTGTTVNGLVISDEEPDLPGYYERRVILGEDAFVMEVQEFCRLFGSDPQVADQGTVAANRIPDRRTSAMNAASQSAGRTCANYCRTTTGALFGTRS